MATSGLLVSCPASFLEVACTQRATPLQHHLQRGLPRLHGPHDETASTAGSHACVGARSVPAARISAQPTSHDLPPLGPLLHVERPNAEGEGEAAVEGGKDGGASTSASPQAEHARTPAGGGPAVTPANSHGSGQRAVYEYDPTEAHEYGAKYIGTISPGRHPMRTPLHRGAQLCMRQGAWHDANGAVRRCRCTGWG